MYYRPTLWTYYLFYIGWAVFDKIESDMRFKWNGGYIGLIWKKRTFIVRILCAFPVSNFVRICWAVYGYTYKETRLPRNPLVLSVYEKFEKNKSKHFEP
jgi:hypothetical protein